MRTPAAETTDYTTDIVYPSAFGAFQAPIHLAYAAAVGGRGSADLGTSFTYCDLGTGAGLTLCVLADCYPDAEFHGVDINPTHVAEARALARAGGLGNVTFHETSFADLDRVAMPRFDFVALSGIYSWVPADLRRTTMRWIAEVLEPNGLLFLHYAALPGNSQIDALYALIRQTAAGMAGNSIDRFRAATAVMMRLAQNRSRFFETNPYAAAWLKGLPDQDQHSMAHEVLNAQSTSLSIADAAAEAGAHDLRYLANAQIELNHLALVAPAQLLSDLTVAPPITREMLLDAIRNAHSRMDVYGPAAAEPRPFLKAAGDMMVDRLTRGPLVEQRAKLQQGSGVAFGGDLFTAMLAMVDGAALSIADLSAGLVGAGFGAEAVEAGIQHAVATKLLNLLRRAYAAEPGPRPRLRSTLNRLLLEERIELAGQVPLASPVAGTQVLLPPADRLTLLAMIDGDFDAAWARMTAAGQRVTRRGKAIEDADQLRELAVERAASVGPRIAAQLGRLGIVE